MSDEYGIYHDEDSNVIGMAECDGRSVLLISAPGKSINWEHLKLFPTLDENRVVIATPVETIMGVRDSIENDEDVPVIMGEFLNSFLNEAVLLADKHFESIED